MAYLTVKGKAVYYESYGEGKPLLLLNGIMMSCASWKEFIEPLSAQNRLILVDMLDQGKSEKMSGAYDHAVQLQVVDALLDYLKLNSVVIAGISYGSEVALEYAIDHPERVEKLILFNATAATGPWLDDIGRAWNLSADNAIQYYYTTIPIIYSPQFYKSNIEWMKRRRELLASVFSDREFMDAMIRLTESSSCYDVRDKLCNVKCPTLVVSCQQDYLTPIEEQQYLAANIPDSHYLVIQNAGHASMYEQPLLFSSLILGFANNTKTKYTIT